jgi:hypothetical protein
MRQGWPRRWPIGTLGTEAHMPRFSISTAMSVVALAAANCAVIRAVFPGGRVWDGFGIVVVGLLPLLDAQVIGLYLLASRYRIALRRRAPQEHGGAAPAFAAANALALVAVATACAAAPAGVMPYLENVLAPVDACLRSVGLEKVLYDSPFFRSFAIPALVGAALSGPPLLLPLMLSWIWRRYTVVITPCPGPASPSVDSLDNPSETQADESTA